MADEKIKSLQTVRAIAFLGIFTLHCEIGQYGAWGVSVFVILSGFVMTYTYYERNIDYSLCNSFKFSMKKIHKLYGLHVMMTIAALVLAILSIIKEFTILRLCKQGALFVINLLLLQNWFPKEGIYFSMNSVAWYLALCLFIYFAFPTVLKYVKKIKSIKQAFFLSLIIYLVQCIIGMSLYFINIDIPYVDNFSKWVTYILPVFRLGDFVIGCLWGYIFINRRNIINDCIAAIGEVVVLVCILISQYIYDNQIGFLGAESFRYNMLFTVSSVALVYLFAINKGVLSKVLTCKPIIYLGNISAYTFLIHQIVIRYIDLFASHFYGIEMNKYFKFICAFAITIICSEVYKFIENSVKKKKIIYKK